MPFTPKNLDDRTFKDLVDEAKRRIVAYLPTWTDHNESDPGITLVQLFAWLTETTLFRLNQVPDERMYVSFLNLVGIGPSPAIAATGVVELEVSQPSDPFTLEPFELRLSAPGKEDDIPFEASERVHLVGASLGAVLVDDGFSAERQDLTATNQAGKVAFAPFGLTRLRGRSLYLGLDAEPRLVKPGSSAELSIFVRTDEAAVKLEPASTSNPTEIVELEGDVRWEGRTGASSWKRLELVHDETRGLRRSGFIRVKVTDDLVRTKEAGDLEKKERFWIRAVSDDVTEIETRSVRYVSINAARIRQWRTYANELLVPGSDGTPDQVRTVRHPPILMETNDPPIVEVNEPDDKGSFSWQAWPYTVDLASRKTATEVARDGYPLRAFTVSEDRSQIVFGNGIEGRIPLRGPNNLRVTYRSGGGTQGNVQAEAISLATSVPNLRGVTQREPTAGGEDEETIDHAKLEAPRRLRTAERAVTAADFETIAKAHAGVARATAINRHHPLYPHAPLTGAVTLVVVPPRKGEETAPMPTQTFLDGVSAAIEPYRILTTELFVVAPRYRTVVVDVTVRVKSEQDAPDVRTAIGEKLRAYFDPIRGGPDGSGWPLQGTIVHGEVMSLVLSVDRVAAVNDLHMAIDGLTAPDCTDVPLDSKLDLLASGSHSVKVVTESIRR
ncbi:putative baseplate assembly protein [Pendulispora brunnea]|uniref:Baseplate assembly protein n=1 Tax=Pendulispora brunnea TaxID=2905690 RepID=A0ABZ2KMR0_9BACT